MPTINARPHIVNNQMLLLPPLTFAEESGANKLKILLGWLLPKTECDQVKSGKKIQNVSTFLNEMKFNGYLRIFSVDYEILKPCMSDNSWKLFLDFKKNRENDAWICGHCAQFLNDNDVQWKCRRCLLCFHEKCAKPQIGSDSLCFKCLFQFT